MGRNLTSLPISASFQYLMQISGSDVTDGTGSLITDLNVTATTATTATTASFATTAATATTATTATTASYVAAANVDGTVANATSASFAVTASHALNVSSPTLQVVTDAGSSTDNGITINTTDSPALTLQRNGTNQTRFVQTDSQNTIVLNTSGSQVAKLDFNDSSGEIEASGDITLDPQSGKVITTDISASGYVSASAFVGDLTGNVTGNADTATTATTATTANTASYVAAANVDGTVANATSASYATTASHALISEDLVSTANINIASITASSATFTSASIGYLQTVTGSATIIGDAFILLNNDTPTQRYAGIQVYDSGSPQTSSLTWDGGTDDWFYEFSSSATHEFGVVMMGPEYATKGSPSYPTANTLVKGNGGHHLEDSSITDDGTDVTISANVSASGYVSASAFSGDGSGLTNISGLGELQITGSSYYAVDGGSVNATNNSVGIGISSSFGGNDVVVGSESGGGSDSVAIGHNANAGFSTTAVGKNSQAGNYGSAIGWGADASGGGTAVGRASAVANNAVAVGGDATCADADSVAVGTSTDTSHQYGLALGHGAQATGALNMDIRANNASVMTATTASQDVTFAAGAEFNNTVTVNGGLEVSESLFSPKKVLTITSQTASMDCSTGNFFSITLVSGSATQLEASNLQGGQTINLLVEQPTTATDSYGTMTFGGSTAIKFAGGTAFEPTQASGSVDIMTFVSFDTVTLHGTGLKNFS